MSIAAGAGISREEFIETFRSLTVAFTPAQRTEERVKIMTRIYHFLTDSGLNHLTPNLRAAAVNKARELNTEPACTDNARYAINRFLRAIGEEPLEGMSQRDRLRMS
jgi:NAD-dependent SIR2 family protein deacetylase